MIDVSLLMFVATMTLLLVTLLLYLSWRGSFVPSGGADKQLSDRQRQQANVLLYQEKKNELDLALAVSTIDASQHQLLLLQAQQQLLNDVDEASLGSLVDTVSQDKPEASQSKSSGRFSLAIFCFSLFAFVGLTLFMYLPQGFSLGVLQSLPAAEKLSQLAQANTESEWRQSALALENSLSSVLQSYSGDYSSERAQRYAALSAQLQTNLGKFEQAEQTYGRLAMLSPDDGFYATSAIEAAYFSRSRQQLRPLFTEAMRTQLQQLAKKFPDQTKLLSLLGTAEFEQQNYVRARDLWQRAIAELPPASPQAQELQRGLQLLEMRLASQAANNQASSERASITQSESVDSARRLHFLLDIDREQLSAKDLPNTAVFVFARPVGGRIPLAARRLRLADLPMRVELSEEHAMAGGSFAGHDALEVSARLSRSGAPTGQAGDLEASPQTFQLVVADKVVADKVAADKARNYALDLPRVVINKPR